MKFIPALMLGALAFIIGSAQAAPTYSLADLGVLPGGGLVTDLALMILVKLLGTAKVRQAFGHLCGSQEL